MLTIPSTIKALYQTDGVQKNFRVHFPNGEYSDITNSNVVSESVRFTESLCSQSVFKFGLAEASVLEFETVGVGNMYGMTIEASMEIDTSSLSAADITAIQADEGDGTLVLVGDSDIGYGFYRIPLGTFRVDKCPRNHGAMAHRQVTAYAPQLYKTLPAVEQQKLSVGSNTATLYNANLNSIILPIIANNYDLIQAFGYTRTAITPTLNNYQDDTVYVRIPIVGGTTKTISCEMRLTNFVLGGGSVSANYGYAVPKDSLYSFSLGDFENCISLLATFFTNRILSRYSVDYDRFPATVEEFIRQQFAPRASYQGTGFPTIGFKSAFSSGGSPSTLAGQAAIVDGQIIYPYLNAEQCSRVSFPYQITCYDGASLIGQMSYPDFATNVTVYEYTTQAAAIKHEFSATAIRKQTDPAHTPVNTFIDCYEPLPLINGNLELYAKFYKDNRLGAAELVQLDNTSPASVLPANYSECWWDEYDVSPIGTVTINYQDEDGVNTTDITIGDGASRYDMSNNEFLKNMASLDFASVSALINADFAPYAGTVAFTPTELTMQGWPWLEAGDALEITAEDGTVVDTYALRVEMSGIQHLQMSIVSEGGEIIEEVS